MYKFILAFGLLFITVDYLNCMELSSSAKMYKLKSDKDLKKLECMIDISELEKIESTINNGEDIFYEAAALIPHLESLTVQKKAEKNITIKEFIELMIEQCAVWFIEKIVNDRLLEYSENDPIRLLFEKGITLSEKISADSHVIAQDSNLPNLPNELLLIIFIKGLDLSFDPIEPMGIDEINRQNNFFTNLLSSFCEGKSGSIIEKSLKDGSKAQLRMAAIKAIKYIKNIMLINKNFYLFAPELIDRLRSKISSELLYEKIFELFRKRKNYSLMLFLAKAQKIDINFRFKRWDCPEVGFLRALIWDAISKRKSWLPIDNILRVIKLLIYSGIDLRIADKSETVLIDPILEGDEYFAIFLVRHAPKMALDKMALHFALAMKMPKLVNLMTKKGALIEIEDIETAECYKELSKAEINKTQPSKCIVC